MKYWQGDMTTCDCFSQEFSLTITILIGNIWQLHPSWVPRRCRREDTKTCDCSTQVLLVAKTDLIGDSCPTPTRLGLLMQRREDIITCVCSAREFFLIVTALIVFNKTSFLFMFLLKYLHVILTHINACRSCCWINNFKHVHLKNFTVSWKRMSCLSIRLLF